MEGGCRAAHFLCKQAHYGAAPSSFVQILLPHLPVKHAVSDGGTCKKRRVGLGQVRPGKVVSIQVDGMHIHNLHQNYHNATSTQSAGEQRPLCLREGFLPSMQAALQLTS